MVKSYRVIVLALGLIFAGTVHANSEGAEKRSDAQQSVAASLENISSRYDQQAKRAEAAEKDEAPCGPRQYKSNADLCAQWKAADAASDSAWWAWAGGVLGMLSLAGVCAALALAFHSNWIARDTAKRQLRAYIHVEGLSIRDVSVGKIPRGHVRFINAGQTPAYNVSIRSHLIYLPEELDGAMKIDACERDFSLGPGRTHNAYPNGAFPIGTDMLNNFKIGAISIFIFGEIKYTDAFGTKQITCFRSVHNKDCIGDLTTTCVRGNSVS